MKKVFIAGLVLSMFFLGYKSVTYVPQTYQVASTFGTNPYDVIEPEW